MNLLLLEDDEPVARGFQRMMELLGHSVSVTAEVAHARETLEAGSFDLVFIDVGLAGGQTGLDLVRWMRSHRPSTRRVIMSGAVELRFALLPEVERYLRKPFGRLELEAALGGTSD